MLFVPSTHIYFWKIRTCHILVIKLTKCEHPHKYIYSKVTSLTQLLRETHSRISKPVSPTSRCGTRFGIHKAAGWRFPNTTLMDILSPCCAIQLLGFHQDSDGEWLILSRLPSIQLHPAKPSHHPRLHVIESSDLQLHGRGAGGWSGAKLSLKAAGAHLWTDFNVWVGTPES